MMKKKQCALGALEVDGCVTCCCSVLGDSWIPHHILHHGHPVPLIVVSPILPIQIWESYVVLKAQFLDLYLEDKVTLLHGSIARPPIKQVYTRSRKGFSPQQKGSFRDPMLGNVGIYLGVLC